MNTENLFILENMALCIGAIGFLMIIISLPLMAMGLPLRIFAWGIPIFLLGGILNGLVSAKIPNPKEIAS